jgi:uncharacterized membrane protein (DUF4010 family)
MHFLNEFYPYFHLMISIALGLLVGLQREWAESTLAGIRSFTLISLLGTLSAFVAEIYGFWLIGVGSISTLSIVLIARYLSDKESSKPQKGLVTEFSILIMYFIGVLVLKEPLIAAAIACIVAAVLHEKSELHSFVSKFDKDEIRSIMQFLLLTLVILPVIPDKSFGPHGALNLHNIWLMVIIISGISLFGYIIYKFRGQDTGILWGGILGGIISSTATTLSYSRNTRSSSQFLIFNGLIILIAWATLYIRVFLELYTVAPAFNVTFPLILMMLVSSLSIFVLWRKSRHKFTRMKLQYNPTNLMTALTFALSYTAIIYAFSYMKDHVGDSGLALLSFLSGILDVDAITLSTGRLVNKNLISHEEGFRNFFLAIVANISFKGIMALVVGGKPLFKFILIPWILSLMTGLSIFLYSFF